MEIEVTKLRVAELANERGWTTNALATNAGISHNTARAYIQDAPYHLSRVVLEKLAAAFEVGVRELFA
jgi:transcriptional regulator with XRE-family HTH domain